LEKFKKIEQNEKKKGSPIFIYMDREINRDEYEILEKEKESMLVFLFLD
jgi:hypothetical protein